MTDTEYCASPEGREMHVRLARLAGYSCELSDWVKANKYDLKWALEAGIPPPSTLIEQLLAGMTEGQLIKCSRLIQSSSAKEMMQRDTAHLDAEDCPLHIKAAAVVEVLQPEGQK